MKALMVVDMQKDFMPGGSLAVPGADGIVPVINQLMDRFSLVLASKDWHPPDHMSFAASHPGKKVGEHVFIQQIDQVLWPVHCVRNTDGSEFTEGLQSDKIVTVFYKGTDKWIDSYSAFYDNAHLRSTGLSDYLRTRGIKEIYLAGLVLEYCVLYTALDAVDLGFQTFVVYDACRSLNLDAQDEDKALSTMSAKGITIVTSDQVEL